MCGVNDVDEIYDDFLGGTRIRFFVCGVNGVVDIYDDFLGGTRIRLLVYIVNGGHDFVVDITNFDTHDIPYVQSYTNDNDIFALCTHHVAGFDHTVLRFSIDEYVQRTISVVEHPPLHLFVCVGYVSVCCLVGPCTSSNVECKYTTVDGVISKLFIFTGNATDVHGSIFVLRDVASARHEAVLRETIEKPRQNT